MTKDWKRLKYWSWFSIENSIIGLADDSAYELVWNSIRVSIRDSVCNSVKTLFKEMENG